MARFWTTLLLQSLALGLVASQQVTDIWQTTWNHVDDFASVSNSTPLNFATPLTASVDGSSSGTTITIGKEKFQQMVGFGSTITDSSATVMNNLKSSNSSAYKEVVQRTFSPDGAGSSYVRVPIGATDFSASVYSWAEKAGDTKFDSFSADNAPAEVWSLLKDIISANSDAKVHVLPWSPPAWMKTSKSMNGGSLLSNMTDIYPTYLLKAVQAFESKGIPVWAVTIQNEPRNSKGSYPTCTMDVSVEASIAKSLRTLLNNNNLSKVKIIGYEHNWDTQDYPISLVQEAGDAIDGVSYHCYKGNVTDQETFASAYPNKEIYFTECTGMLNADGWSGMKWSTNMIFMGAVEHGAKTAAMWNFALDETGGPSLPNSGSCVNGCKGSIRVSSDGSVHYNPEWFAMAQSSKAIIPVDKGGPYGERVSVDIEGGSAWALNAVAYVTGRTSASDDNRVSLVVMNWFDTTDGAFSPQPVKASINFGGKIITHEFPVGLTTLQFFVSPSVAYGQTGQAARKRRSSILHRVRRKARFF